jgi:3-isopropylmalate/(R)-2-methylmalate dehydratase large subunit
MGQTITEKIFSEHIGEKVYAEQIVRSSIDMVIGNDITTPISIKAFEESGAKNLLCYCLTH